MKISFQNLDTKEVLKEWNLNASQERFFSSKKKVILFSGGFGCGKSLMLVLKAIDLSLRYPKNFILMGRKTYVELRDTLIKEFFVICPEHLIRQYYKAEMKVEFVNGSEIIFRHLDKIAETELRSMNLGAAFIDQAEDLPESVFLAIKGRLRRDVVGDGDRKIYMTMNPELTWHYRDFKQHPKEEYDLIEASTMENAANLPEEYVKDLLNYPESFRRQYVDGVWDESLLSGNTVFAREHIEKVSSGIEKETWNEEGILIYRRFTPGHRYQMGIDVAEGSEEETEKKDKSSITVSDLTTEEEVAHWSGQIPPDAVAEKASFLARKYQDKNSFCVVVPEMNSIGLALVNKLNEEEGIYIYRREEFDRSIGKKTKKLGWRTTRQTKMLLINNFAYRLRKQNPKVHTKETIEEFKTFIYSDEARKSGAGAKTGFHDDRIMATLLSFFEPGIEQGGKVYAGKQEFGMIKPKDIHPTLEIVNGKARIKGMEPREAVVNWKTL